MSAITFSGFMYGDRLCDVEKCDRPWFLRFAIAFVVFVECDRVCSAYFL
ncbi:hypothetical protein [Calothrix sp. 336/3]|nr:hypothetical protein [Calothrix sp. 336/3]